MAAFDPTIDDADRILLAALDAVLPTVPPPFSLAATVSNFCCNEAT